MLLACMMTDAGTPWRRAMVSTVSPAATVTAVPPSQLQLPDDAGLCSTDPVTSEAPGRPGPPDSIDGQAERDAGCARCRVASQRAFDKRKRGRIFRHEPVRCLGLGTLGAGQLVEDQTKGRVPGVPHGVRGEQRTTGRKANHDGQQQAQRTPAAHPANRAERRAKHQRMTDIWRNRSQEKAEGTARDESDGRNRSHNAHVPRSCKYRGAC